MRKLPRFRYFVPTSTLLKMLPGIPAALRERGPKAREFERRFARAQATVGCHTVSSFRMGLHHALRALMERSSRKKVLLTPITIPDAINSIHTLGLEPSFIEMDPATHSMDLTDLSARIDKECLAVVVTYLSGIPMDVARVRAACDANGTFLIEDFSQITGSRPERNVPGTCGHIGICSLSRGKVLSALCGGAVISNDRELLDSVRAHSQTNRSPPASLFYYYVLDSLKVNLATSPLVFSTAVFPLISVLNRLNPDLYAALNSDPEVHWDIFQDYDPVLRESMPPGFHFHFSEWQAELALTTLDALEARTIRRQALGKALLQKLSEPARERLPAGVLNGDGYTFYHLPLNCSPDERRSLLAHLLRHGVDAGGYSLNLCNEEPVFGKFHRDLPAAKLIKTGSVLLPLHESFAERDAIRVAEAVNAYFAPSKSG